MIGISIMFVIHVEGHVNVESKQKSNLQGIKEGFTYLKENVFIKRLIVLLIIVMILISPVAFNTFNGNSFFRGRNVETYC